MIPIIFVMPFVQLLILANAADFEVKNISMHVIDEDMSQASTQLINKFRATHYFNINYTSFDMAAGYDNLEHDRADLILRIPPHFERDLTKDDNPKIQLTINAINGSKAGIANAYASSIIYDYNSSIQTELLKSTGGNPISTIDTDYAYWFNPQLNYKTYMVPGILVSLVP
jgi:ABC-2 type transport system permease protein